MQLKLNDSWECRLHLLKSVTPELKVKAVEDKLGQREVVVKTKEVELKRREGEVGKREKVGARCSSGVRNTP